MIPADATRAARSRRRPWRTVVATLVVGGVLIAAALVMTGFGGATVTMRPGRGPVAGQPSHSWSSWTHRLQVVLQAQSAALVSHDRAGFLAGWAATTVAQRRGAAMYANLSRLGVDQLGARIDPGSLETPGHWTVDASVRWRSDPAMVSPAVSSVRYTFGAPSQQTTSPGPTSRSPARSGPLISAVRAVPGTRCAVWLLPRLRVRTGPRTLVVGSRVADVERAARLAGQAVTAVAHVLPRWRGTLVVYAPGSAAEFDALLAARPTENAGIAAVTTTVDGSAAASAPSAVVLNPSVFAGLGPIGAHVVVTHEATHVATDAAAATMPEWLVEGFADYVGIGSVRLPVGVAARAALLAVRRHGPPPTLPSDAAFASGGPGLEATYEQAWLATTLIADRYGRSGLVAFYHAVSSHPDQPAVQMHRVLHTSIRAFTAAWRQRLVDDARAD